MLNKNDILDYFRQNDSLLKKQFKIQKIGLFGSFARGDQSDASDIDVLIELQKDVSDVHGLKAALRDWIGNRFHRKVDIAREKYLRPYARQVVLDEAIFVG